MSYSPEYLSAWRLYELHGHNFGALKSDQLAALESDLQTKRYIDRWRREMEMERAKQSSTPHPALAAKAAAPVSVFAHLTPLKEDGDLDTWLEKNKDQPAPIALVQALLGFVEAINKKNAERNEKISALEQRVQELEAREYQGTWSADKAYAKGASVTHMGSLWYSNVHHNHARPGEHPHWTLQAKRGRDGKDAR